jgi:hypothetical protein
MQPAALIPQGAGLPQILGIEEADNLQRDARTSFTSSLRYAPVMTRKSTVKTSRGTTAEETLLSTR